MTVELKIAVRELVELTMRSGDLDASFRGSGRSVEAIRAHQRLQARRPDSYTPEVPVSHRVEGEGFRLAVSGRIDGVDRRPEGIVIEEIKTTTVDSDAFESDDFEGAISPLHTAQARVYAFMYVAAQDLAEAEVRLTYVHLDTGRSRSFAWRHCREELALFFEGLVKKYMRWARMLADWRQARDASIRALDFPFSAFRRGQREMAVAVYQTVRDGRQLIVQAATGIGKSAGILYPALKAMAEGAGERIFYLTARTTGKAAAEHALKAMRVKGLSLKTLTLTAKERICFQEDVDCTPETCPFAKGHFDRVNSAVEQLFARDDWVRQAVEETAAEHRVCPFALSLDLCLWAECIICDYNYAFDPRVYLRRFFLEESGNDNIFLVDEAHNLVDRAREMFSADITKEAVLEVRRQVKGELPAVYRSLTRLNSWLLTARRTCAEKGAWYAESTPPGSLYPLLERFGHLTDRWLQRNQKAPFREALVSLYFTATGFLRVAELFGQAYATCYERTGKDLKVRLFCIDPSLNLKQALTRCRAAVFFSATMTPTDYFKQILGCESAGALMLPSPFPATNFVVFVSHRVSTLYRHRDHTAEDVLDAICGLVLSKPGNYLAFFPSYAYMEKICEAFRNRCPEVATIAQSAGMGEGQRSEFLARFSKQNNGTLVGFVVMGGVFGEGIDLVGERLCGAVVVGVGLPGICPERDLIRRYFADKQRAGFEFAYLFPGINRVLQAAGRVIRSETDRGVVLLVDRRFATARYRQLLPSHWGPVRVESVPAMQIALKGFWGIDANESKSYESGVDG